MASFMNPNRGLLKKLEAATKLAIDQTTAAAVIDAKNSHPFQNVTGVAEGSIQMRPALRDGDRISGQFGSWDTDYFLFLEIGTVNTGNGYPTLRPALDREAPNLAERIRKNLEKS